MTAVEGFLLAVVIVCIALIVAIAALALIAQEDPSE